jgi:hypothetical protein
MTLLRRQFLHLAAAATFPAVSRIAVAQTYPARPVRFIVGVAAGGGSDLIARLIGQWLSERLGQQFVVENRPGAGDNIATEGVVAMNDARRYRGNARLKHAPLPQHSCVDRSHMARARAPRMKQWTCWLKAGAPSPSVRPNLNPSRAMELNLNDHSPLRQ